MLAVTVQPLPFLRPFEGRSVTVRLIAQPSLQPCCIWTFELRVQTIGKAASGQTEHPRFGKENLSPSLDLIVLPL